MENPSNAGANLTTIFEHLEDDWDAFRARHHLAHYHQHQPGTTPATEAPAMSLATIVQAAEADAKNIDASAHRFLSDHLPALGELASQVENSTLLQTVLGMVGTLDPAAEELAVTVLKALAAKAPAAAVPAPAEPQPAPEPVAAE